MGVVLEAVSPSRKWGLADLAVSEATEDDVKNMLEQLDCDLAPWDRASVPATSAIDWANRLRGGIEAQLAPVQDFIDKYPDERRWLDNFERFLRYSGGFRVVGRIQ